MRKASTTATTKIGKDDDNNINEVLEDEDEDKDNNAVD